MAGKLMAGKLMTRGDAAEAVAREVAKKGCVAIVIIGDNDGSSIGVAMRGGKPMIETVILALELHLAELRAEASRPVER